MKKKILSCALSLSLLGAASAILATNGGAVKTDASAKSSVVISDNFNSSANAGTLDEDIWTDATASHSIAQSAEGKSYLSAKAKGCGGENLIFGTKNKLSGITSIGFDFKFSKGAKRWFTMLFCASTPEESFPDVYSGASLISKDSAGNLGGSLSNNFSFASVLETSAEETWISAEIKVSSATSATLNFALQGKSFDDSKAVTLTYRNLDSCYFGIGLSHDDGQIDFDNFSISYDGGTISEDFASFDFDEDPDWRFFKKSPSQANDWFLSDSSTLTFTNVQTNDLIYSKSAIEEDASIVEDVEAVKINFFVSFSTASTDEKIALVLGIDPSSSPVDYSKNVVRYEISKTGASLVQYKDGEAVSSVSNKLSKIASGGSTITISISKKGAVNILENGTAVKDETGASASMGNVSSYVGNVGILALTPINGTVEFDNIKVINTTYYVPVTKSVTHNFSNDFFGNKGFEDFLCVDGDGGGKTKVEDGKLVWDRATDGTFFGSAYQYDSFILDYKLCSIYMKAEPTTSDTDATALTKWIGLDLSKSNRYSGAYGSYAMLMTLITPEGNDDYSSVIWTDQTSTLDKNDITVIQHKAIPSDYFKSIQYSSSVQEASIEEGDAVCFRYVSDGSNLKLYLKKAKEAEFELYTEVKNLELNGYFALCCTGFTYCKIDDFSMANTSSIYVAADNEAPETITETETKVIYDHNNTDTNLDTEISLNKNSSITLPLILGIVAGVELLGIGVLIFLLAKKGKGGKHE